WAVVIRSADVPVARHCILMYTIHMRDDSLKANGVPAAKRGRGAAGDPINRFLAFPHEPDGENVPHEEEDSSDRLPTQFLVDRSESIITENDSPDVPFRYSLNPYRGCEHGCSYCYARPGHEYLGLGAGLDFESKIF